MSVRTSKSTTDKSPRSSTVRWLPSSSFSASASAAAQAASSFSQEMRLLALLVSARPSGARQRSETPPLPSVAEATRPKKTPARTAAILSRKRPRPVEMLPDTPPLSEESSSSGPGGLASPSEVQTTPAPPTKRAKRLIHKIFADCIEFTNDQEWKGILAEAASGKLHNATFSHNKLKSKGATSKVLTVENLGTLQNVFEEVKSFFQQKMHTCFTDTDKMEAESMETPQFDPKTLNEVSAKQQPNLLSQYCERLGEEAGYTSAETDRLHQDIHYLLTMKILPKTHIHMQNKSIEYIEGVEIVGKRMYMKDASASATPEASPSETRRRVMSMDATKRVLKDLLSAGTVRPISGDQKMEYPKTKLSTQWKRLQKMIAL